jgi:AcrR family transcriptional regulator
MQTPAKTRAARVPRSGKRSRRTQAERSSETQRRLVEAAIGCLHRLGYSATSVLLVAQEAGVTRGAMVHHYPTKVDLMLDVVRRVFDEERLRYRDAFEKIADLRERALATPRILWDVLSRPSGVAVLEIMMGSRSDAALAAPLASLQARIEAEAREGIRKVFVDAGATEFPHGDAMRHLFVAAIRGLMIDYTLSGNKAIVLGAVGILREVLSQQFGIRDDKNPRVRKRPTT